MNKQAKFFREKKNADDTPFTIDKHTILDCQYIWAALFQEERGSATATGDKKEWVLCIHRDYSI